MAINDGANAHRPWRQEERCEDSPAIISLLWIIGGAEGVTITVLLWHH